MERTRSSAGQTWLHQGALDRSAAAAAGAAPSNTQRARRRGTRPRDRPRVRRRGAATRGPLKAQRRIPRRELGLAIAQEEGERHASFPTVARLPERTGSSARTTVPCPASSPPRAHHRRLDAVAQALQARPTIQIGAADAVDVHLDQRPSRHPTWPRRLGIRALTTWRAPRRRCSTPPSRPARAAVRAGETSSATDERRPGCSTSSAGLESALGEDCRMDAPARARAARSGPGRAPARTHRAARSASLGQCAALPVRPGAPSESATSRC